MPTRIRVEELRFIRQLAISVAVEELSSGAGGTTIVNSDARGLYC
jgi:hypothetical protein